MREIKFRFYDNKDKEMIVPTKNERKDIILEKWEFNPKASELMQYTGMKDKNGTEIYEGDIIWDAHAEIHGKVIFDEGTFCVEWATHIEHLFEVVSDYYAEVIGNIYEKPEILGDNQ